MIGTRTGCLVTIPSLSTIVTKDLEGGMLRKAILQFIKNGYAHFTDIEKKPVATCLLFATPNTFREQSYGHLLPNAYMERVSRGIYRITPKGDKLLEISDWIENTSS